MNNDFIHTGAVAALALLMASVAIAQDVTNEGIPGVRNFARLGTTVACAGATDAQALPAIKKLGFASIVNLRLASEPNADIEKAEATAKELGLQYFHVPFAGKPDAQAADAFLAAITTPGAEPAFIHCAGGNRAATMWLIKRLVVDRWEEDRAVKEAIALGQTSEELRNWALAFAAEKKRKP